MTWTTDDLKRGVFGLKGAHRAGALFLSMADDAKHFTFTPPFSGYTIKATR
jgi:hypothetical protein